MYEYKIMYPSTGFFETPVDAVEKFLNNPENYEGWEFVQVIGFTTISYILFRRVKQNELNQA